MLGTVVVTSGICALVSDALFTLIAFYIGRNSRPVVKVNHNKYKWYYKFMRRKS